MKMTKRQAARILEDLYNAVKRGGGNVLAGGLTHHALRMSIEALAEPRKSIGLTPEFLMTALERADVLPEEDLRIEFSGDDNTPQELVGVERRESEGVHYVCVIVRNT